MNFQTIILIIPPVLLALTFHEFMHGWVANKLGDPTAKNMGRLTMNPLAHLDPIGTLMIIIVHFGWAKPVPVNPNNLRDPKKDMVLISVAGPAANIALAFVSGILLRSLRGGLFSSVPMNVLQPLYNMVYFSLQINIALAFFNLIPIPPLDGSKILRGFLPYKYDHIADWLEQYGSFVLMGLIVFGMLTNVSIIGAFLSPFIRLFMSILGGV